MEENIEDEIEELHVIEHNMQQLLLQKQNLQLQLIEVDNALGELAKKPKQVFKVTGSIMVESKREDVEKELTLRKEIVDVKLKNINKEEDRLKKKAKEAQSQVLSKMKKDG